MAASRSELGVSGRKRMPASVRLLLRKVTAVFMPSTLAGAPRWDKGTELAPLTGRLPVRDLLA
ncbi:hypothetical protein GCM10023080_092400 [Streptomyces pseudoechinosporeus]